MSDTECGAICVRKDVMDKFNVIMEESKLDANELMEHFFSLYNCQVKTENEDFLPVGMTFNGNNASNGNNIGEGNGGSKNSSLSESDEVTCLGVTQIGGDCSVEDKVHLLQRLREQAGTGGFGTNNSSHLHGGAYQHYTSYSGSMGPPSMVPLANAAGDLSQPRKRKKAPKRAKLCTSPSPASISEGEDLLKSSMCSLCQATFARFTDLLTHHKEVHSSDTNHPLRCRACGRTQTSEAGLIYHQVYVCKMVERPHQCHICSLKFQSEEMVLVHKCSGCPRKRYACEFCDHYRTESSSDLEKHMRIHTNDKCYVCKVCGFSTAWKKNLKEHMVKHLGLKPYICDLCGYSTSDRHNLRSHRLKHFQKGEGCEKCGGECRCHKTATVKKRKMSTSSSIGESGGTSPSIAASGGKDLECPYPQCVYRTKIEYMMSNHMLRHQGMAETLGNPGAAGSGTGNSSGGGGGGASGGYSANSQNAQDNTKSSQQHRGQGVMTSSSGTGHYGVNTTTPASSSMTTNQSGPPTLISSANQIPLEWKNIGQAPPGVCGMLSPATHFPPLVHHQQGHLPAQAMSAGALSSWATPLSPPTVPGLLTNRMSVSMAGQNMVARPMPVFPNMPN